MEKEPPHRSSPTLCWDCINYEALSCNCSCCFPPRCQLPSRHFPLIEDDKKVMPIASGIVVGQQNPKTNQNIWTIKTELKVGCKHLSKALLLPSQRMCLWRSNFRYKPAETSAMFSEWGPQMNSVTITQELAGNANYQVPPKPPDLLNQRLGVGPAMCALTNLSRDIDAHLTLRTTGLADRLYWELLL